MTSNFLFLMMSLGLVFFLLAFISKRKHLLATLLSLEGMMLLLMLNFYLYSCVFFVFHNFVLVFLTLAACEGALGLSLLVCVIRNYGGDQFNSFNFLQC